MPPILVVTGSQSAEICRLLSAVDVPQLHFGDSPADADLLGLLEKVGPSGNGKVRIADWATLASRHDTIDRVHGDVCFVIACSTPEAALERQLGQSPADKARELLHSWEVQTRKVLGFAYRFRERCLVVESGTCLAKPVELQTAIARRFDINVEGDAVPSYDPPALSALATLITTNMIGDDPGVDELSGELAAICDVIDPSLVSSNLKSRREQALAGSVLEYRQLTALLAQQAADELELQMAMTQIDDLHKELEDLYRNIQLYRSQLAMVAQSGALPTLTLARRVRNR